MNGEMDRQDKMYAYERELYSKNFTYIAGIDEVGRGPLAGPVVSAAVVLPKNIFIPYVNDSKKLSAKRRESLSEVIKQQCISWGLGVVSADEIDKIGIVAATRRSMMLAVEVLGVRPQFLLVDAESIEVEIPQKAIVKGDCLSLSIAAASIVAKVERDNMLEKIHMEHPCYGFARHKGYGTREHIDNIRKFGPCSFHRRSFITKFI